MRLLLLFFMLPSTLPLLAQKTTTQGREFFVSFYKSLESETENILFLTSKVNTTGKVSNPNTGFSQAFSITAGTVTQVVVPLGESCNTVSGQVNNLGLQVTSADTIAVYALSSQSRSSDATTVLQKGALGTDYVVASYNGLQADVLPSCFLVEATHDNTSVRITPSVNTADGNQAGVPFVVTLNKGQTYYVTAPNYSSADLSGSLVSVINGCEPIAVFGGSRASNVPVGYTFADILYEQLFPINSFGKQFITATLKGRNVYRVRVYAAFTNTTITIDGKNTATINAGELYEFESNNQPKYITTSNPAQVVLFGACENYDILNGPPNEGDPTMLTIPPLEQQLQETIFLSPAIGVISGHKVSIICKTADALFTILDGKNVGDSFTVVPGNPVYSQAALDINAGQHEVKNSRGFIAYAYGFGNYQGYGYCTGSSVEKINTYFTYDGVSSIGSPVIDACKGPSVFKIVTSETNAGYTWDFGDGSAPVTTNGTVLQQTHTYLTPGTYIVKLTTTSGVANACIQNATSVTQLSVRVFSALTPALSLVFSPAAPVCQGTKVSFVATAVNAGSNPVYQWKLNGVNVGTNSPTFVSSTLVDKDIVSCAVTSNLSCATTPTVSASLTMQIAPTVVPSVTISTPSDTLCSGSTANFTAVPVAGAGSPSYQWKVNGANMGISSPNFGYPPYDGDVVSCVITISNGCAAQNTALSNIVRLSVLNGGVAAAINIAAVENPVCAGTNAVFIATASNGGTAPVYQWKLNGSNVGSNSPQYSNAALQGNDIISCIMTSNSGCATNAAAVSNNITMQVLPLLTPSVSIVAAKNNICPGDAVTFTAQPVNGGNSPVYEWRLNGNVVGGNGASYSNSNLINGDIVSCVMNSNANCAVNPSAPANVAMVVNVIVTPEVSIAASKNPVCKGEEVTFTASSLNGGSSPVYTWTLNGNVVSSASSNSYSSAAFSDGDKISCKLVSSIPCATVAVSQEILMKVYPLPTVAFNPAETIILYGSSYQLHPVITGNVSTYLWTPSSWLSNAAIANPVSSAPQNQIYKLTVTTTDECSASASMNIIVFRDLIMPNAFTPNGDGNNDLFRIPAVYQKLSIHFFTIYNRWGQKVFETNDISRGWDGNVNGLKQPSGAYVWAVEYLNPITKDAKLINGAMTLIR